MIQASEDNNNTEEGKPKELDQSSDHVTNLSAINVSTSIPDKIDSEDHKSQTDEAILSNNSSCTQSPLTSKEVIRDATPTSPLIGVVKEEERQATPGQLSSVLGLFKKTWQGSESKVSMLKSEHMVLINLYKSSTFVGEYCHFYLQCFVIFDFHKLYYTFIRIRIYLIYYLNNISFKYEKNYAA